MTHADNSAVALLGRSRDTGSIGAAPTCPPSVPILVLPSRRAVLRVWGNTPVELERAIVAARDARGGRWVVVETVPTVGGPCPIPSHDPLVLAQGAWYGWAWAAHPQWVDHG